MSVGCKLALIGRPTASPKGAGSIELWIGYRGSQLQKQPQSAGDCGALPGAARVWHRRVVELADPDSCSLLVFVYGSLMSGEQNHQELARARLIHGEARLSGYELVAYIEGYPALRARAGSWVLGEVYELGPELLAQLDAFEEHPIVYERRLLELEGGLRAWAWVLPRSQEPEAWPCLELHSYRERRSTSCPSGPTQAPLGRA